jgi:hypothetical protein
MTTSAITLLLLGNYNSTRAEIRVHVKRLLRKYDYPPDLRDAAVQNLFAAAAICCPSGAGGAAVRSPR